MSIWPKKNQFMKKSNQELNKAHKTGADGTSKSKQTKRAQGSYRIIGGSWRSRRLNFPAIEGLRPTTDRVRETLFNWLASEIQGARVLDVFAGSGALGIEALSRGASALVAIEKDKTAWRAISDNIAHLLPEKSDKQVSIIHDDALALLTATKAHGSNKLVNMPQSYDLVFLDPPFRQALLEQTLALLDLHPLIDHSALIYIEYEKEMRNLSFPSDWRLLKEKMAGQVRYLLFRRQAKH